MNIKISRTQCANDRPTCTEFQPKKKMIKFCPSASNDVHIYSDVQKKT
jgi:hypothetical protein